MQCTEQQPNMHKKVLSRGVKQFQRYTTERVDGHIYLVCMLCIEQMTHQKAHIAREI